jgi:REP element-mobilizing transposase RayT
MCRGNNGQEIFLTPDGYRLFLSTINEVCVQTGWKIHAYCLMSNHYHLLLETPEANLVAGMKWFQGTYTQRYNAMFKRRGHVFQGRYKAIPVQTDPLEGGLSYFRMVSTYIHLNPFRANLAGVGMEIKLERFSWSSYPLYTGSRRNIPDWLVREKVLGTWGIQTTDVEGLRTYRQKIERYMRFELDPDAGRRGEFEKQIKRGWYLGAESFADRLLEGLKRTDNLHQLQGDERRAHNEKEAERLLAKALKALNCNEGDLLSMKQNQPEKQAVAWLLKSHTTVTVIWIAQRLQMGHRTNATRGISRIRNSSENKIQKLRTKMLQCTA